MSGAAELKDQPGFAQNFPQQGTASAARSIVILIWQKPMNGSQKPRARVYEGDLADQLRGLPSRDAALRVSDLQISNRNGAEH